MFIAGAFAPEARAELRYGTDGVVPLEVLRAAGTPRALVLRLPASVDAMETYRLRVADTQGNAEIWLNLPQPQWFAPRRMPSEGRIEERDLYIVGRELDLLGASPRLRLSGPKTVEIDARLESDATLGQFLLRATLPRLAPGDYRAEVQGDDDTWYPLDLPLTVYEPPLRSTVFVDEPRFGGCHADDVRDDTACVLAAVEAAQLAGGGTVSFGTGTWRFDDAAARERAGSDGIALPRGVDLVGRGAEATRLVRGATWNRQRGAPLFVALGDNAISGLAFDDAVRDRSRVAPAFLRLGRSAVRADQQPRFVEDIRVTRSSFSGAVESIDVGSLPVRHLDISHNLFRAWRLALALGGDSSNYRDRFRIEDALIAHNRFEPGSYLDVAIGQGARATEIGGAVRLLFLENIADGTALGGLDSGDDAAGWRAAFFWHLTGPQEQLLIAANQVTCAGDKAGDGEAIALDNNHNTFPFDGTRPVLAARPDSVDLDATLSRDAVGLWLQVVDGRGLGQSRRVVEVTGGVDGDTRTRLRVAPGFDVLPDGSSRVLVARQFWQTYIVANDLDERRPTCRKSNRNGPHGGRISLWAMSSDSVVAGNRQYDTDGITFQMAFKKQETHRQGFLEIRDNQILGEYDDRLPGSQSGIQGSHGAAPDVSPPVLGFGVRIARNRIVDADGVGGAAIGFPVTWYRGPAPHDWPLILQPLVFGNDIDRTSAGILVANDALLRNGAAFGNRCGTARDRLRAPEKRLLRLCSGRTGDCECGR